MAMRLIAAFLLLMASAGCLKKSADENALIEPNATETVKSDALTDVAQEPNGIRGKGVSVEPALTQVSAVEKSSIQDIQQALKNINLYEGKIDGILGPNTRKAIEAFQSQNGLKVDGKVGPKTWQKLKEHLVK